MSGHYIEVQAMPTVLKVYLAVLVATALCLLVVAALQPGRIDIKYCEARGGWVREFDCFRLWERKNGVEYPVTVCKQECEDAP